MSHREARRDAEFTIFMDRNGPALLRIAWLLTGDHHAAQELTQAILVKTFVAWPRVRSGEALAYARRILANHQTDSWRATRRERLSGSPPEPPSLRATDQDTADDRDHVVRLLRGLPEQQRKVVVLRYYADLSERATAELLGISVGAVKSAASRGLAAIRAGLAPGAISAAAPGPTPSEHSEEGSLP